VGLPDETRQAMVELLNQSLADTTDLMTQCKFAHWNVKGMNFYQLHLLFDEIAEEFEDHADIIAERATALGGEATGTVRSAASDSRIPGIPPEVTTGPEYVQALVERVGVHANHLREEIEIAVQHGDEDTADMFTELSREVDKQLYFLEAHLQAVDPEAIPESPGGMVQGGQPSQYGQPSQISQQAGQRSPGGQQPGTQIPITEQPQGQQPGQQPQTSQQPQTGRQLQTGQQTQGRQFGQRRYGGGQSGY
jgi:starvation-inducible DNA-binding protein